VVGLARLRDEVLARWIADSVSFPSSMVDRITPWTSTADRDDIARTFGVDDRWPVITEAFSQWVVEDDFCNGRPPLEAVGVGFVADVTGHQLMKTRLLNGSHSALGYLGHLAGLERIDEVMHDEVLREYVTRLMAEEIGPLLPRPAGIDLAAYQQSLLERFANPAIGDRLERLCRRGSSKVPDHLLPSLRAALEQDRPFELLALAVAGWFRYLRGVDLAGQPIEVEDEHAERLTQLARAAGSDPWPLLAERSLFGDLADDPRLVEALASALQRLDRDGVRATLATALHARPAARRPAALAVDDVPAAQEQLA
jgi:fructuronate reductase/mannitol 2-dehydrogenase